MHRHIRLALGVLLGIGSWLSPHAIARPTPQGTSFTYQGQLKQGVTPVNTTADFQFTLFDALTIGNQIGTMQPANAVTLSNGQFTVELDFGANAFDGNDRFLQIAVRSPAGSGSFTTLSPRQKLAATPYALQTRGITVDAANNVGIGTTSPTAPLHIAADLFPTIFIQDTGSSATQTGYVSYRNNANVETGWVGYGTAGSPVFSMVNARAGGDIELYSIAGGSIRLTTNAQALTVNPAGNVGIGTTTPTNRLSVNGNANVTGALYAGAAAVTPCYAEIATPNVAVYGESNGSLVAVIGHAISGIGVSGFAGAASGGPIGVNGRTLSASGFDFMADGVGIHYGSSSSIRWKRNVEPIDRPLDRLSHLRGVYFDWDAWHGGRHDVGMIAEEVGRVMPEIVGYEENGIDATGMDYGRLTPLLVESIKALRVEKDRQLAEKDALIAELRDRLDRLERTVAALSEQKESH